MSILIKQAIFLLTGIFEEKLTMVFYCAIALDFATIVLEGRNGLAEDFMENKNHSNYVYLLEKQ